MFSADYNTTKLFGFLKIDWNVLLLRNDLYENIEEKE